MVSLYAEAFCVPESALPLGSIKTDPICNSVQKQRMKEEVLSNSPRFGANESMSTRPRFGADGLTASTITRPLSSMSSTKL